MRTKNPTLNKKTGKRLKDAIRVKYPDRNWQKQFMLDIEKTKGKGFISKTALSQLCNGITTLERDRAETFAKILNIDTDYLLCLNDFPSAWEKFEALRSVISKSVANQVTHNKNRIMLFTNILDNFGCIVRLLADDVRDRNECYTVSKKKNRYYACSFITRNEWEISENDFIHIALGETVYLNENIIVVMSKVHIIKEGEATINLNVEDFRKMMYDMESRIDNCISFWRDIALANDARNESWNEQNMSTVP